MFSQFFYSVLKQSFSKKTSLSSSSRQTEALSLSTHFLKESSIALPKLYCYCSPSLSHTEALLLRFLYSLSLSLLCSHLRTEAFCGFLALGQGFADSTFKGHLYFHRFASCYRFKGFQPIPVSYLCHFSFQLNIVKKN